MAVIIYHHCTRCARLRLHKPLVLAGQPVGIYCTVCGKLVEQVTFEAKDQGSKQQGGR